MTGGVRLRRTSRFAPIWLLKKEFEMTEEVVRYPEPVLRDKAKEVSRVGPDIKNLVEHMKKVLHEVGGLGLAANQVGVLQKVFVYIYDEKTDAMINPKIVKTKGEQVGYEGCLSFPGLHGEVRRAEIVVVKGLDCDGRALKIRAEGTLAKIFQHEIDHLNGTLFIDRAVPDTLQYISDDESEEEETI